MFSAGMHQLNLLLKVLEEMISTDRSKLMDLNLDLPPEKSKISVE